MRNTHLFFLLPVVLCLFLVGCQSNQHRGVAGNSYLSSSRPTIAVNVRDLPLVGSERKTVQLRDAGVLGGLPVESWISVFGTNPMAVIAHADLPSGWKWDANLHHSFAIHESMVAIGGIEFHVETLLERPGKNPFLSASENEQKENWLIRAYAARFNADRSKIVLEYREKAPKELTSLQTTPYGQTQLLADFEKRADKVFHVQDKSDTVAASDPNASLESRPIPDLHIQYLDEHFLGTATPNTSFPFF